LKPEELKALENEHGTDNIRKIITDFYDKEGEASELSMV
jgi:hypothetical protein